jgi:hypothetical protein
MELKSNVICNMSILMSLNSAWINDCFRASASAKAKGQAYEEEEPEQEYHLSAFLSLGQRGILLI